MPKITVTAELDDAAMARVEECARFYKMELDDFLSAALISGLHHADDQREEFLAEKAREAAMPGWMVEADKRALQEIGDDDIPF